MAEIKTIPAGLINKRILFKQPSSSLNNEGGEELTFSDAFETRAMVDRFNQFRTTEAHATSLLGALDFTIRWAEDREEVTKDWLITYKGRDYTIHLIETLDQRQRFIRFTAKVKSDGAGG